GGRFVAPWFDMRAPDGSLRLNLAERSPKFIEIHGLLATVPQDQGLAVPFYFGAPLADREVVTTMYGLNAFLRKHNALPNRIDVVALQRHRWSSVGRFLTEVSGMRLIGLAGDVALLGSQHSTWANGQPIPWKRISATMQPLPCDKPIAHWPEAQLTLCGVALDRNRHLVATVRRDTEASSQGLPKLRLNLFTGPQDNPATMHFRIMDGLVHLYDLEPSMVVTLTSEHPAPGSNGSLLLAIDHGSPMMPVFAGQDSPAKEPWVPVQWP
ncbi:MAG: hypothetical protein AAFX99_33780, partial [Myxococcota bacterium]